jgi:hypothetical protein
VQILRGSIKTQDNIRQYPGELKLPGFLFEKNQSPVDKDGTRAFILPPNYILPKSPSRRKMNTSTTSTSKSPGISKSTKNHKTKKGRKKKTVPVTQKTSSTPTRNLSSRGSRQQTDVSYAGHLHRCLPLLPKHLTWRVPRPLDRPDRHDKT